MNAQLPSGFRMRHGTLNDIPELAALDADYSNDLYGRSLRTEGELRTEWKAPYFDPSTDSRLVIGPDGRIVAWAEVYDYDPHIRIPSRLRVAPRGIPAGAAEHLIAWCIDRAKASVDKAPSNARVVLTQSAFEADRAGNQRLLAAGMKPIRTFLRLQIEMTEPPEPPEWPHGISVRTFVPGQDDVPALEVARAVFRDHWGHVETPFEDDLADWRQWIYEDEDFDVDLWFLAIDGGEIIGFCQCYPVGGDDPRIGLIDELGVKRSHRGRGVATALLRHAFGVFFRRGKTIVDLGVDAESLTGATRLYEKVGMKLDRKNNVYELELRPGEDLANQG
ncbi:GNAT family N-acetyltransferase [Candidatus Bipolaricaulota bacterium]